MGSFYVISYKRRVELIVARSYVVISMLCVYLAFWIIWGLRVRVRRRGYGGIGFYL